MINEQHAAFIIPYRSHLTSPPDSEQKWRKLLHNYKYVSDDSLFLAFFWKRRRSLEVGEKDFEGREDWVTGVLLERDIENLRPSIFHQTCSQGMQFIERKYLSDI